MKTVLIILLEQGAFLLLYALVLRRTTFFQWNRVYLLATSVLALLLPFIQWPALGEVVQSEIIVRLPGLDPASPLTPEIAASEASTSLAPVLWIWGLGSLIALALLCFKLWQWSKLHRGSQSTELDGHSIRLLPDDDIAFSFFNHIYVGEELLDRSVTHILAHENVHVREKHSWDMMFIEALKVVFWFQPAVYLYQRYLAEVHEFVADAKTPASSLSEHYEHLLSAVFRTREFSFVHPFFNHSLLKKRIVMLTQPKTRKIALWRYALLIPALLVFVSYVSCESEKETPTAEPAAVEKTVESNVAKEDMDMPFTEIAQKPAFKTPCAEGVEAFQCFKQRLDEHVIANFRYPEEAQAQKLEGRVYVLFRIDKEGTVKVIKSRGQYESLSEEATRIIESLPRLEPGRDAEGNPMNVTFAYPIVFALG